MLDEGTVGVDNRDEREALRATFDEAAERYDRARPRYPPEVFDDIELLGRLAGRSRILEIGCGTGQATGEMARRGHSIVAIEMGPELAAIARRNLQAFPNVEIVVDEFERWPIPDEPFDAVVSATAFHWLDPTIRLEKSAAALRGGGTLAVIDTDHVAGGTEPFFVDVQECYERWDPKTEAGLHLTTSAAIDPKIEELEQGDRFKVIAVRRHEWDVAYSTTGYLDLLQTYSGHLALEPGARKRLLDCIGTLIDGKYAGRMVKRYLTTLRVARRAGASRR